MNADQAIALAEKIVTLGAQNAGVIENIVDRVKGIGASPSKTVEHAQREALDAALAAVEKKARDLVYGESQS